MLETIEKLEKDIETFHKNVTSSNELHKNMESLIKLIGDQSKQLNVEFESIKELIDNLPPSVKKENEVIMASYIEKFSVEKDKMVGSLGETKVEIDSLIRLIGDQSKQLNIEFESTKELINNIPLSVKKENEAIMTSYIENFSMEKDKIVKSLGETKTELENSVGVFNEKYNQFLEKLESTNMDQIYRLSVDTKKSLETRTLLISLGLLAIVVLNIAILIFK
jgi:hypothetical protein